MSLNLCCRLATVVSAFACLVVLPSKLCAQTVYVPVANEQDFVYDPANSTLYITAGSSVDRYDVQTSQFLSPIVVNGGQSQLMGIDLSPDGTTLAVADKASGTTSNWIWQINTTSGAATQVDFNKAFREEGTYSVAYDASGQILATSIFNGSGFTPLRLYDPSTATATTIATPVAGSILTPNASHSEIVVAVQGQEPGTIYQFNSATTALQQDVTGIPFFPFDGAMNPTGTQLIVPTYGGGYVYNGSFQEIATLGVYASYGPLDAAYSPNGHTLYATWWNQAGTSQQIYEFSATNLAQTGTLNAFGSASGGFSYNSERAFGSGELKISPDSSMLFAGVGSGVSIVTVPEPGSLTLAAAAIFLLALCGSGGLIRSRLGASPSNEPIRRPRD